MLSSLLQHAYDDGVARNIHEWRDGLTGDYVVRLDLHISDLELQRAQRGGDTARLIDTIVKPIDRVKGRAELKLRYDARPRPRIGAGTLGCARRKR